MTVAGSDSGGGAGIQADLKTFAALGAFGVSAITCVTSQNPNIVSDVVKIPSESVQKQIETILDYFPVAAMKTGMLFSKDIITAIANTISKKKNFLFVLDPVMIATSGAELLQKDASEALQKSLFPLADVITPNLDEAGFLLETKIRTVNDMKSAITKLVSKFQVPFLLKGGHLEDSHSEDILDFYFDGNDLTEYVYPRVKNVHTHGTGCTFSSAITAKLALGEKIQDAITHARQYLQNSLTQSLNLGTTHTSLNHFPEGIV